MATVLQLPPAMPNTRSAIFIATAFTGLVLAPTFAVAMPRAGSNELRLESTYVLQGTSISGLNHDSSDAYSSTRFGAGFALGRFLTDNLELGATAGFIYLGSSTASGSTSSTVIPGIFPFVRLFSPVGRHVGLFASAVAGYQVLIPDQGSNITVLSAGGDVGAELFLADAWSLRVGPTYRYADSNRSASTAVTGHSYGVNWAIAGYF
jgi:hypothetical protein